MQTINILILSAGRRVELIECFKRAALKEKINSKIIAADISNTAPAMYFADKNYIIPKIGEEGYIENIIDICNKESIKLIIPTIDTELLILAKNKANIESRTNARVMVSNYNVINICRNKINTQHFFEQNGFGTPKLVEEEDIKNEKVKFPVFIKPLDGSSSINTFKVNNMKELRFFKEYIKGPIIQELVEGPEYTTDIFCDFDGNPITIVPRKRIATRSGEIIKGKIEKDREIIADIKKLINVLKPIGQITIQCIKTKEEIKYIEINPRFGGGAPMSIKAGADSCQNIYKLLSGKELKYNEDYKENLFFLRFDDAIMLDSEMNKIND